MHLCRMLPCAPGPIHAVPTLRTSVTNFGTNMYHRLLTVPCRMLTLRWRNWSSTVRSESRDRTDHFAARRKISRLVRKYIIEAVFVMNEDPETVRPASNCLALVKSDGSTEMTYEGGLAKRFQKLLSCPVDFQIETTGYQS